MKKKYSILLFVLVWFSFSSCGPNKNEAKAYNNLLQSVETAVNEKIDLLDVSFETYNPKFITPALAQAQKKVHQAKAKVKRITPFYGNDKFRKALSVYLLNVDTILHTQYPEMLKLYQKENYNQQEEEVYELLRDRTTAKLRLANDLLVEAQKDFITKYNLIVLK